MGTKPATSRATSRSKRDQLVETALRLFEREGCQSVGIDRILREAGVAKMTLYRHFESKDELILAALRLRDERFRNWLARRVREMAETPRDRMLAMFDAAQEWFSQEAFNGCLFMRTSAEFLDEDHPVRAATREHSRLLHRFVTEHAREAGASEPEVLASHLMLLFTGASAAAQVAGCCSPASCAKQAASVLIDASIDGADRPR